MQVADGRLMSGRYAMVDRLLGDRRVGRDYLQSIRLRYGETAVHLPLVQGMSRMFLLLDPPLHTQLRGLMTQACGARQMESMREVASDTATGLIDAFQANGHCDLLTEFAFPLPIAIICRMLDIDAADVTALSHATSALAKVFDPMMTAEELQAMGVAYDQLARYFHGVIARRRSDGGDDLIARFIQAEDNGRRLSEEEIVSDVILLFLPATKPPPT